VNQQLWAGVDAGKSDLHCVVLNADGHRLVSQRVANDETVLLNLIPVKRHLTPCAYAAWLLPARPVAGVGGREVYTGAIGYATPCRPDPTLDDLREADKLLVSSSLAGVVPAVLAGARQPPPGCAPRVSGRWAACR
jgi:hypothetical protein